VLVHHLHLDHGRIAWMKSIRHNARFQQLRHTGN
jgi:hypothetical protein